MGLTLIIHQLTSSSTGNCTVISTDTTEIMIDVGIPYKTALTLYENEFKLDAIFITHEHQLGASVEESTDKLLSKNENSKYCSKCKELKLKEAFRNRSDKPHLLHSWCRACENRKHVEYNKSNPLKAVQYNKSEKRKTVAAKYRKTESNLKSQIKYRFTESYKQSQEKYRTSYKGKLAQKARSHNRRLLDKLNSKEFKLTSKILDELIAANIAKYGGITCVFCSMTLTPTTWTLDHIIPVSKSGTNKPDNLAVCCRTCNSTKHAKSAEEFKQYMKTRAEVARHAQRLEIEITSPRDLDIQNG